MNLYFKLTTIPQTENVQGKELELYFKKYQESNNLEDLNQATEDYYKNSGKNPLFGKIYSLTVGYLNGNEARITVLKGDEKNIIQEFINLCNNDHFKNHRVTGWNFSFLLPFLRIRAKKNRIHQKLHKDCEDLYKKAWTITGLDLFDAWKGLGFFQSSLEEVAELTFEITTDFVDGKDVYNYYKNGKFEELDNSSADEIMTLINVHRGINGEEFVTEKTITVSILEDVKVIEQPLLERLYNTGNLNKEEIEKLLKNNMAEEEKSSVKTILTAHYQKKGDKVGVKKQKEQEINDFIDSL